MVDSSTGGMVACPQCGIAMNSSTGQCQSCKWSREEIRPRVSTPGALTKKGKTRTLIIGVGVLAASAVAAALWFKKREPPCPPWEEAIAVSSAQDHNQTADEYAALFQQFDQGLLGKAMENLVERLDQVSAKKGALTRSDMKQAFVQAALAKGATESVASNEYDANAAQISAYMIGTVVAGGRDDYNAVLSRSRKCAKH